MLKNSDGVDVCRGRDTYLTGDTGFKNSKELFYCGRVMTKCRCGKCHGGRCGPNGCPCHSCVELVGFKLNRNRTLSKKHKIDLTSDLSRKLRTILRNDNIYYCGDTIPSRYCSCEKCPPTCGPYGCPCLPCLELISKTNAILRLNSAGCLAKQKAMTGSYHCQKFGYVERSHKAGSPRIGTERFCDATNNEVCSNCVELNVEPPTTFRRNNLGFCCRKAPNGNYYCGRRVSQCECGNCDGFCGPKDGCPCQSCEQLVGTKIRSEEKYVANEIPLPVKPAAAKVLNGNGAECHRGSETSQYGGDTGMLPKQLYYCGRPLGECRCGGYCNLRCGPHDGCPCNSCFELVLNGIVNNGGHRTKVEVQKRNIDTSCAPSAPLEERCVESAEPTAGTLEDSKMCIICLVAPKICIVTPCGHYAYCGNCVESIKECAVCRENITSFMKVYEP